jgi:hypothetical protein
VGAAALAGAAGVLVLVLTSGGSSRGLSGLAPGSVGRIDPSRATLVQQFQVGGSPTEVAVGGGAVWTANETDRTVTRVDVPSGRESSIAVGAHPDSIAIGADAVWAGCRIEGTVLRIDPQLLEVTQRVRVSKRGNSASAPSGLAVGAGSVWTVFGALTLTRVAAGAGRPVASLTPDAGSNAVTYRTGGVWVGGQGAATEVDPATNEASTQVTQLPGNTVAIGADARWVWAVTETPSRLVRIDPGSSTVANTLTLADGAAGVATGGGWVWVSNPLTRTVERVDPKTMKVTATIAIGARPTGIAYGEGSVWVSAA